MSHEKVTLIDVGKKCGVHRTTVGLALRNHPSIPEKTRQRILKAVEELGYRPDPALSSLVAYRHRKADIYFQTAVAIISDSDFGVKYWRTSNNIGAEQFVGLSEQADHMGYKLEEYSVGNNRSHYRRVNSILRARGIHSVIITGLENLVDPIDIDWDSLSPVSMSHSLVQKGFPRVTTHHRFNAAECVRQMIKLGYRRIGLAITRENDRRVDFAWTAGFLSTCYHSQTSLEHHSIFMPPNPYPDDALATPDLITWIMENNIEIVISTQQHIQDFLKKSGFSIPEDIGYCGLDLSNDPSNTSGIDQNFREIGRQTLNLVANLNHSNQTGIPEFQQVHLVEGIWCKGRTVRQQSR